MSGIKHDLQGLLGRLESHEASRKVMAEVLETLTPHEKLVTCATFGLFDVKMLTVDEIALHFGIVRGNVVCIRQKALRKLSWHTRYPRLVEAEKLIAAPSESA